MQDIAFQCFKRAGFERGVEKKITQKSNVRKEQFVAQKQLQQLQEIEKLDFQIAVKKTAVGQLVNEVVSLKKQKLSLLNTVQKLQEEKTSLQRSINRLWSNFKHKLSVLINNIQKGHFDVFYVDVDNVQQVIDSVPDEKHDIAITLTSVSNSATENLKAGTPFRIKKP